MRNGVKSYGIMLYRPHHHPIKQGVSTMEYRWIIVARYGWQPNGSWSFWSDVCKRTRTEALKEWDKFWCEYYLTEPDKKWRNMRRSGLVKCIRINCNDIIGDITE